MKFKTTIKLTAILILSVICFADVQAALPRLEMNVLEMKKIDEVDLGLPLTNQIIIVFPKDVKLERRKILEKDSLIMPSISDSPNRYVAVHLGAGKGLKAGKPYVLQISYPEDLPRSMIVYNTGNETRRGFHTGTTLGDALKMPYVYGNPESINYPLSGKWQTWTTLFELNPHYVNFPKPSTRDQTPEDGFWVVISHYDNKNEPISAGLAVGKIALYEAPSSLELALKLPPKGLPRRHIFWREEMSDGHLTASKNPAFDKGDEIEWFEAKMRLAKFLGIDTYSKDLLEFGHNQHWDSSKYGGNEWVYQSKVPHLWNEIVKSAGRYGLNVLPMYEYCGSVGGKLSLGRQKRCKTLHQRGKGPDGRDDYTHVHWSEKANADITDPDTLADLKKILDITIKDERNNAQFIGAWLRPRNSGMPISFSNRSIKEFSDDTKQSPKVTRQNLIDNKELYNQYISWWQLQRRSFFENISQYLRQPDVIGKDAVLLFTGDPTESGKILKGGGIVTDDPSRFPGEKTVSPEKVLSERLGWKGLTDVPGTWGGWEWQHSVPALDPFNYKDTSGVMLTMAFSRQYSVADSDAMEAFRTPDGLAMIRHYPLNEHVMKKEDVGYFVVDFEEAGPYCMLAEARALANGDPRFIGYLLGNNMQRGFPMYVRAFNRAFLALPALPSKKLENATSNSEVVVREIKTDAHGTWYAVINTSMEDAIDVLVRLKQNTLVDYITGERVNSSVPLSLYPGQVLVWYSQP